MARKSKIIYAIARKFLNDELAKTICKSVDIIGDIAVIKIPDSLEDQRFKLGQEILNEVSHLRVILRQISPVLGNCRIRNFEWLAGEDRTITIHKEYGSRFKVDLKKMYFSPRLGTERNRIANKVDSGEQVLNMFAGVGCFSILIAKMHKRIKVFSIDINPYALVFMINNVFLNKQRKKVISIFGDANAITQQFFKERMDRILMPLPEKSEQFLDSAVQALKPGGGIIHYQSFVHADKNVDPLSIALTEIEEKLSNLSFEVEDHHIIREIGPFRYQVALDLKIKK